MNWPAVFVVFEEVEFFLCLRCKGQTGDNSQEVNDIATSNSLFRRPGRLSAFSAGLSEIWLHPNDHEPVVGRLTTMSLRVLAEIYSQSRDGRQLTCSVA